MTAWGLRKTVRRKKVREPHRTERRKMERCKRVWEPHSLQNNPNTYYILYASPTLIFNFKTSYSEHWEHHIQWRVFSVVHTEAWGRHNQKRVCCRRVGSEEADSCCPVALLQWELRVPLT